MQSRTKFLAICLGIKVLTTAIAGLAVWSQSRFVSQIADANRIGKILYNHAIADMVHDGLRSDVFSALLAQVRETPAAEVEKNLADKVATFQRVLIQNRELAVEPDVQAALRQVEPAL
jgi:methyl-accepting chemotaxis protein